MDWSFILSEAFTAAFGPVAAVFALAAIGLNIHFGYTGLLNFGQAGFMAVGAYGLATSVQTWGLSFWVGLLVAFGASIGLAILLGIPTLRLRADYLAIATIGASEIIRLIVASDTLTPTFGGSNGRSGFASSFVALNPFTETVNLGLFTLRPYDAWVALVGWVLVAVACVITWALMRSPWGRVVKSIREDEEAVRSLGKNVFAYKMQSLVLGGLFGSLAGIVFALSNRAIIPSDVATDTTFFAYAVLLLGGAARVLGPVLGSVLFYFILTFLGTFFSQATGGDSPLIPAEIMTSQQSAVMRFIFLGAIIMLLMVYRPQGIIGDRRELAIDGR